MSALIFVSLLLIGCGSSEESADVPGDTSARTAPETLSTTTSASITATPSTVPSLVTSTTITSSTVDDGAALSWRPPIRVDNPQPDEGSALSLGMSFRSPAAASGSGVVIVTATPQAEGFDPATKVWFSLDALTWEPVELITGVRLRSLTAAGPGFVAVGREDTDDPGPETQAGTLPEPVPAVWTSTDGLAWAPATRVDRGPFAYGEMTDIAVTDAGLVAVGEVWDSTGPIRPTVWSSPDGFVWTMVLGDPLGTTEDQLGMQVAVGRGGFVAIGQTRPIDSDSPGPVLAWWSPDGVRWDLVAETGSFGTDLALGDLVAFGSGFALGGSRGAQAPLVWLSSDGRTWENPVQLRTRAETGSSFVRGLATDGSILVAVGDDVIFAEDYGPATGDASIWMSSDGTDWDQVPPEELRGDAILDTVDATSVLRSGDGWIVLGTTWDHAETAVAGVVWFSD